MQECVNPNLDFVYCRYYTAYCQYQPQSAHDICDAVSAEKLIVNCSLTASASVKRGLRSRL